MPAKYRAEQAGSLLRPQEVLDAHEAHAQGRIPVEELRRVEDEAILKALDMQKQSGIEIFTDGEYRRGNWAGDFADAMDGYVEGAPPIPFEWRMPDGTQRAPQEIMRDIRAVPGQGNRVIGERLRQRRRLTAHESAFLKKHAPGPYKVKMPAASYMVARGFKPGITDRAYGSRSDLIQDVVKIIQAEVKALVDEGATYIQ